MFKASSSSTWVIWGRYLLIITFILAIVWSIVKWYFHQYLVSENSIVLREGVFVKEQRSVPFDRIHNQKSNTTFVHRWFDLTSLTLETGTIGENASFHFPVITEDEKRRILLLLEGKQTSTGTSAANILEVPSNRTVHFRSTKKDLIKASFTSLSFFAIFPILSAIYFNLADFFEIERTAQNALDYLLIHWWMLLVLLVPTLALSFVIGFIKTTIKYGNYVISDDKDGIYIEKGAGNFISFSILKNRVQAVVVKQSMIKRMLGLASIKLISAGSLEDEKQQETSSLYPFMPKQEAYRILQTMLPGYEMKEQMERFPIKVLWLKLLQPYYLTIAALVGLIIFKKEWIWAAAPVFFLSVLDRVLDYWFTSYIRYGNTIQIRKGGFTHETFVTHRERIQQITVQHSWLERRFGVATILFSNKAKPLYVSKIYGISKEESASFYHWFHQKSAS